MMMSFCKKSVHSLLGLTTSIDTTSTSPSTDKTPYRFFHHNYQHHVSSSLSEGLGLVTATEGDVQRSPNVLESSSVKSTQLLSPTPAPLKKDPGVIGFIDDMGGGVDGLMSCTESLGFESSDERRFDDKIAEEMINENDVNSCSYQYRRSTPRSMKCWRKQRGEVKKFPPPLSSLRPNGQRNFFLRAVRKDGRLELTEVRIDRIEVLQASREDGRLRLHLIRENEFHDRSEEVEDENQVVQQEVEPEQEEEEAEEKVVVQDEEEENVQGIEEEKEEEKLGEWKFPVSGEGFRWCHELVSHHHEHHHHTNHHHKYLHALRQHCVTTG